MRLRFVSLVSIKNVVSFDVRNKDKSDHEDSTGLLPVGDVASTDTEQACNDVWRDLGQC